MLQQGTGYSAVLPRSNVEALRDYSVCPARYVVVGGGVEGLHRYLQGREAFGLDPESVDDAWNNDLFTDVYDHANRQQDQERIENAMSGSQALCRRARTMHGTAGLPCDVVESPTPIPPLRGLEDGSPSTRRDAQPAVLMSWRRCGGPSRELAASYGPVPRPVAARLDTAHGHIELMGTRTRSVALRFARSGPAKTCRTILVEVDGIETALRVSLSGGARSVLTAEVDAELVESMGTADQVRFELCGETDILDAGSRGRLARFTAAFAKRSQALLSLLEKETVTDSTARRQVLAAIATAEASAGRSFRPTQGLATCVLAIDGLTVDELWTVESEGASAPVHYVVDLHSQQGVTVKQLSQPHHDLMVAAGSDALARGDHALAWRILSPTAEQGSAAAQVAVGTMYLDGIGVEPSLERAIEWFRRAADQGDASGQYHLGMALERAAREDPEAEPALPWYRRAAEQRHPAACTRLGDLYARGELVDRDDRQAMRWYRTAADRAYPEAQARLGALYLEGRGVASDPAAALELFRAAARAGDPAGATAYAHMLEEGLGIPQDRARARRWYAWAKAHGDTEAAEHLAQMQGP